jgi:hypothetical protein
MRIVAEAWNNLTDEQRNRWDVAGPSVPSRKGLGKTGHFDRRGCSHEGWSKGARTSNNLMALAAGNGFNRPR